MSGFPRIAGSKPIRAAVWPVILLIVLAASCARIRADLTEPKSADGHVMAGLASWYGPDFHGRPTASKEIYDMNDMTAAHRTLPFGTWVLVSNLDNGRSVAVRINDRGPFVAGRIIDLSYAAARMLGVVGPGTVPVRLELLDQNSPPPSARLYSVQAGSFAAKDNAERLRDKLSGLFGEVVVSPFATAERTYYRVRIGARTRDEAEAIARRLADAGYSVMIVEGD